MQNMHEYLTTTPFDLYELELFRLVVKHGSFTKAAEIAGLTQAAFQKELGARHISLHYGMDELAEDLKVVESFRR